MPQKIPTIDFDVAQALVNYVDRVDTHPTLAWGMVSASDVRAKLCELRSADNGVSMTVFNQWLSNQPSGKMGGGCDKHIYHMMDLVRRASK